MEYLDIVDEKGEPTGEIIDRETAHREGVRHHTSHVWIVREKEGKLFILLQKRSENKDSFPGCFDISSAGHIPAGCGYKESALRELEEELGVVAKPEELIECGTLSDQYEQVFHGNLFKDCQVSKIFLLVCEKEADEFTVQKSEIDSVIWMELSECLVKVSENSIKHCIRLGELDLVRITAEKLFFGEKEIYPAIEECASCKGMCCRTQGCMLSPEDLLKALGNGNREI